MVVVGAHRPTWDCDGCRELFADPDAPAFGVVAMTGHHDGYSTLLRWVKGGRPEVARWITDRRRMAGQSLVEFALVLPLLMLLLLGFAEVACLMAARVSWSQSAAVMAGWIAAHPGDDPAPVWRDLEASDPCSSSYTATVDPAGVVRVSAVCSYSPRVAALFDHLAVGVEAVSLSR